MFDIGISEIMVIAFVALIVLGPEKLPKTARTLGHLFGRLQRYVADVKADINRIKQTLQGKVDDARRRVLEQRLANDQAKAKKYDAQAQKLNTELAKYSQTAKV